jgi:hypothetical protein
MYFKAVATTSFLSAPLRSLNSTCCPSSACVVNQRSGKITNREKRGKRREEKQSDLFFFSLL